MAENLVVNDVTYPEVEAVDMLNNNGERVAFYPDAVRYNPQTLTDAQKAQARTNMGAASAEDVSSLSAEMVKRTEVTTIVENEVENQKGSIVELLITELQGLPVFGVVDDNKTITVTSQLADGIYTLNYENADGTYSEIGTITIGSGKPVMINLADPASPEWKTNVRINSSKQEVTIPESSLNGQTMVMTNLIDISGATNATEIHIKGLDLLATTGVGASYNRVYFYDVNKAYKAYWQPSGSYVSNYVNVSDYDENVQVFSNISQLMSGISELGGTPAKYIVFGAVLTGTTEDVVITKDTQITG